jgi:hypothetical protein
MEKKNVAKRGGNGIVLTVALVAALAGSSCRKDTQIRPEHSPAVIENSNQLKRTYGSAAGSSYKVSQPISLDGAHDMIISGDSISGGALSCISLVNCHNIHITHCKLINSSAMAVNLSACSNIVVDDCYVAQVATGVYSYNGRSISVINNQMEGFLGTQSAGNRVVFENMSNDVRDAASNSAINNWQTK